PQSQLLLDLDTRGNVAIPFALDRDRNLAAFRQLLERRRAPASDELCAVGEVQLEAFAVVEGYVNLFLFGHDFVDRSRIRAGINDTDALTAAKEHNCDNEGTEGCECFLHNDELLLQWTGTLGHVDKMFA